MVLGRRMFSLVAPLALLACSQAAAATVVDVVKSPTCGCCTAWVEHLRKSGMEVRVTEVEDTSPTAKKLGVPDDLRSCHTASVGGYAVEGHVPAGDIRRLIAEKPQAAGIAVPGMPMGSPGMGEAGEGPGYATILFDRAGKRKVFAQH